MILKIANKQLKQPIELSIPDAEWEKIQALPTQEAINQRVQILATRHIMRHGYDIGFCDEHKRTVTLQDCMKCGVSKGWGHGAENLVYWEGCKHEHINYDFSPARVLTNTIKDEKLAAKIHAQTPAEAHRDKQTFSESVLAGGVGRIDAFEKDSADVMKEIKNRENQL